MKILHISAQKPDSTGSGVYLFETVSALQSLGVTQAVIAGVDSTDRPCLPEGVSTRFVRFQTHDLPFPVVGMSDVMPYASTRYRDLDDTMVSQFCAAFREALDKTLREFVPDVIFCHHLYLLCAVMTELVEELKTTHPQLRSCVLCALSHGTDIRQMQRHSLERARIVQGVRRLDAIFALHDEQAKEIAAEYGVSATRIRVLGTGFNQKLFSACGAQSERDERLVLYVGKIWKQKGLCSLIEATRLLQDAQTPLELHLVGGFSDADEYAEISALAKRSGSAIRFLGRVSQDHLQEEYRKAKVFVLPSFSEGLPLVVVEALACGCTVVVCDLPGLRPWLERFCPEAPVHYVALPRFSQGLTPDADDLPRFEADLAKALAQALQEPSRQVDLSDLSWESLAKRLLAFVEKAKGPSGC